eukprot:8511478-Ditylum_brightwellii.AAC.1
MALPLQVPAQMYCRHDKPSLLCLHYPIGPEDQQHHCHDVDGYDKCSNEWNGVARCKKIL